MATHGSGYTKLFTVEQANAMLPLVHAIAKDLSEDAREYVERRHRFLSLTGGRKLDSQNPYDDELAEVERELQDQWSRIQGYADELSDLGVELKSMVDGLVDFPSLMHGRVVYLCWKLGEPEIAFWHERDAGFAGRQPLLTPSLADPEDETGEGLLV